MPEFHQLAGARAHQVCREVLYSDQVVHMSASEGMPLRAHDKVARALTKRIRDASCEVRDRATTMARELLTPLVPDPAKVMLEAVGVPILVQVLDAIGHVRERSERRSIPDDEIDMDSLRSRIKRILELQAFGIGMAA